MNTPTIYTAPESADKSSTIRTISLDEIILDTGTQVRAEMALGVVAEYAELLVAGVTLPPVTVFKTPKRHVLVDGFHRVAAARKAGLAAIQAEVHEGTVIDAVAYALKANATHGLRRTNADKRQAVEIALKYWPKESSRKLAERCGVTDKLVTEVRNSTAEIPQSEERVGRDGRKRPARMPARAIQATAKPAPAVPVVTTPPSAAEQPPLPPSAEPCPPMAVPKPPPSATSVQSDTPATHPDLMESWMAASSAERSSFLRRLVANVPLAQHTAAWAAISGMILVVYEKSSSAPGVSAEQNDNSVSGGEA